MIHMQHSDCVMDVLLILACRDAHSIASHSASISSYLNAKMTWKSVVPGDSKSEQSASNKIIHPRKSFLRGLLAWLSMVKGMQQLF